MASRGATRALALLSALGVAVAMSGCDQGPSEAASAKSGTPQSPRPSAEGEVSVDVSVTDGATNVRPDTKVAVKVTGGTLSSVELTPAKGKPAAGQASETEWSASGFLLPKTAYTLAVTTTSAGGRQQTQTTTFTTLTPRVTATYRVLPDGGTVGVGMPATVVFDSAVSTPAQRAAVQKLVSITTTPQQEGAWGWSTPTQLMWRPKDFWKPGTKVTVKAPLTGVQTGDGKWVGRDASAAFTIGRSRISTVDLRRHTMTVRQNGKTVKTYTISAGLATPKYETRSGTKVITEKLPRLTMDAATLGVPEDDPAYYKLEVDYAMRVTNTGEFLHSAPWSVWAQGSRNVSHGCVNMGPRDAREMFQQSLVGDVVDFVGSKRRMAPGEGMDVWLYSWKAWRARSALTGGAAGAASQRAA